MHRFYLNEENSLGADDVIRLTGESYNHIKNVLRLSVGDELLVGDGNGKDYACSILSLEQEVCLAKVTDYFDNAAELPVRITLYQGVPKGDKLELVIQKACELGAETIVPVMMKRTIVKLDEKKADKKTERYNKIAESAAKQCGRGVIPKVREFMSFEAALADAGTLDRVFIPYEDARGMEAARDEVRALKTDGVKSLGIFIGPEGGFAAEEIELAKEAGGRILSLGNRILRTETAGLAILSILGFYLDT